MVTICTKCPADMAAGQLTTSFVQIGLPCCSVSDQLVYSFCLISITYRNNLSPYSPPIALPVLNIALILIT